jgi:hypothetical protein
MAGIYWNLAELFEGVLLILSLGVFLALAFSCANRRTVN